MTQYHFRDHPFDDTLKPSKAQEKLKDNHNKVAWVTSNGTVQVRKRKPSEQQFSLPQVDTSIHSKRVPSFSEFKTATHTELMGKSMRKVNSANITVNFIHMDSATKSQASKEKSTVSKKTTSTAWCPGHARPRLFDTDPYVSVIHPKPFQPPPLKKFTTRLLNKVHQNQDFARHIARLNRPFTVPENMHFHEKPPRTFYNHLKPEHDFFKVKE